MATADSLIQLEATVNTPGAPTPTLYACKIRRDHFNSLWQTVKAAYDICSDCVVAEGESTASTLKSKNYKTYSTYEMFAAQIMEQIQQGFSQIRQAPITPTQNTTSNGCRLPPIDTEVFSGDYLCWSTLGYLLSAIYIDNPSLTFVEKLFHLSFKKWRGSFHSFEIPTHLLRLSISQ